MTLLYLNHCIITHFLFIESQQGADCSSMSTLARNSHLIGALSWWLWKNIINAERNGTAIMSFGKLCDPVYGLEVLGICLPGACFVRTVIFPIVHWYSWCLRLSHLFTFCANCGPPTSYENLWACLETVETHYNIKEKQRTKYMSSLSTFELSVLLHPVASPAHTLQRCSGRTPHTNSHFSQICGNAFGLAFSV